MAIRFVQVGTPRAGSVEAPLTADAPADAAPAADPASPEPPSPPPAPAAERSGGGAGPPAESAAGRTAAEREADAPLLDPALFPEVRAEPPKPARPRRHRRGFG